MKEMIADNWVFIFILAIVWLVSYPIRTYLNEVKAALIAEKESMERMKLRLMMYSETIVFLQKHRDDALDLANIREEEGDIEGAFEYVTKAAAAQQRLLHEWDKYESDTDLQEGLKKNRSWIEKQIRKGTE